MAEVQRRGRGKQRVWQDSDCHQSEGGNIDRGEGHCLRGRGYDIHGRAIDDFAQVESGEDVNC